MTNFVEDIAKFNAMYGLPMPKTPGVEHLPVVPRMEQFKKIMTDEVNEVDDIVDAAKAGAPDIDQLVFLADWLGDMMIYAASEMTRYGIPINNTLQIIMQSNFSKLGADGQPIIANGKVQKGPNYWKPEPKLKEMLLLAQGAV